MFSFMNREPKAPPPDPMMLLAEAQEFLKEDDFESALEKFDELCSLPVQSPLPLLSRATCRLQLKKYEKTLEDCEKVLKFLNADVQGHVEEGCTTVHSLALMRMAKAYKELGQMEEAKSALMRRNAIEHKLGRDKVDDEEEEEDRESRMATEREAAEEWKEKGNVEFKKENWIQALDCYKNGLGYDMYSAKLHSNTCMALIKLKRWSQAVKHADQCIALEPQWVKGYYMKGLILSSESKIDQAKAVLRQAISVEPNNTQVKALLEEVEARVNYVESRIRRRKVADKDSQDSQKQSQEDNGVEATDSGNEKDKEPVEDVDSDEDHCDENGCRTPRRIRLKVTRKDVLDTAVELGAAAVGVALVWWFISGVN
ncbi:hypothetical protein BX661DRAFT_222025 [Kickxella alabastrina]|uniref:uncharacterized protein n=1 Tax=Kickxella alabastrina TaxID=61397 RepID=UPI002221015F|nr:uncharacterized protein BX661DRAFT_222025 [Kickxella alabastrina]KAI7835140.1 hypothetical protein BX661DRAFT_222025 [Kickxella alabastrina]KAJ1947543.1 hypothetical protein GGF37_000308 [Kickxella alabastrina]